MNKTTNMTRSSLCGLVCLSLLVLNGCANPIVQRTYLNNLEQGNEAMDRNDFAVAEEAFRRALINVRVGNLSPAAEEAALYNLARVYRMQGLYTDAEPLFRQAIEIQEKLDPESASMSRALAELARTYYFQGKYQEVAPLLERALAIIDKDSRLEPASASVRACPAIPHERQHGRSHCCSPKSHRTPARASPALGILGPGLSK